MVTLLLAAPGRNIRLCFLAIAVTIARCRLIYAEQVHETPGTKVTEMNPRQDFAASLVAAGLVVTATFHNLGTN